MVIIFRGKSVHNNQWITGFLCNHNVIRQGSLRCKVYNLSIEVKINNEKWQPYDGC